MNFVTVAEFFLLAWLAAIAWRVLLGLLNGSILRSGLLRDEPGGRSRTDRVQALIGTFGAIGYYAAVAIGDAPDTRSLPEFPEFLLAALAGSQLFYLLGKFTPRRVR